MTSVKVRTTEMETVVKSPKRLLQEALGISVLDGRLCGGYPTAAERLGYRFRCGDIVREKGGRHEARVDAILPTLVARVTWIETGWKGELPLADMEKVS
jgi:hypothetical protein